MHKLAYKFLVGLTSAALLSGSTAVMAEPLSGDAATTDSSEAEDNDSEEGGTTEEGTGEEGTDTDTPGETEDTDPAEGDPADTDPSDDDASDEDPAEGDPAETEPSEDDSEDGDPSETDSSDEEGDDSSDTDGKESGKDDDKEKSDGEDDSEKEDDSDPEKDKDKDKDKDKEKDKEKKDSGSEKESSDKKSSKDSKDEKKSSEKQDAAEETEQRPELTEEQRHPVIPRRTTSYSVRNYKKIKPVYISCKADEALIREYPDSSSEATIVAKISKGAIVRLIDESDAGWWFIETRDANGKIARGYSDSSCFQKLSNKQAKQVSSNASENAAEKTSGKTTGTELLTLKEDPSKVAIVKVTNAGFGAVEKTTYDELSLGSDISGTRKDLVNYALQYLGNPYAEGGTSLTDGTDCVGLARAVYAEFGISLPGSLKEQYDTGTKIPVKKAKTGDLIYYINDNGAKEVMICLSNNTKSEQIQVLQVSSRTGKIVIRDLDRSVMCRARTYDRLNAESSLPEEEVLDLNEWNWVGESRITSYCYNCNTPANSAITASGIPATEWHTVAVDSSVIPLGSRVYIEGYGVFIAEDTGVKGKWCDIYVYNHECSFWDLAQVYYQ